MIKHGISALVGAVLAVGVLYGVNALSPNIAKKIGLTGSVGA